MSHKVNVRTEGDKVFVNINDRTFLLLVPQAARDLAQALRMIADKAEEVAKADQIISDSALLLRSGAPFALTDNPAMIAQAKVDAVHDPMLRKYLGFKGITSKEEFGTPTIVGGKNGIAH